MSFNNRPEIKIPLDRLEKMFGEIPEVPETNVLVLQEIRDALKRIEEKLNMPRSLLIVGDEVEKVFKSLR